MPLATINLPKSPTFLAFYVKVSKSFIFVMKSFMGNFYRHLAIFSGYTDHDACNHKMKDFDKMTFTLVYIRGDIFDNLSSISCSSRCLVLLLDRKTCFQSR